MKNTVYIVTGILIAGALGYFLGAYLAKKKCGCNEEIQEETVVNPT
jgi:hypothetical protein